MLVESERGGAPSVPSYSVTIHAKVTILFEFDVLGSRHTPVVGTTTLL